MKEMLDKLSYLAKVSTDLLFVRNPVSTSMGFFFGVFLHGVVGVASSFVESLNKIAASSVTIFHYIAGGVFIFNLKPFLRKDEVPQQVVSAIEFIKAEVAQGRLTRTEAKQKYRILIEKYIENVALDTATAARIKGITDTLQR